MAKRRRFSNVFKRMVVEEYLSGVATQAQLARKYNLSSYLIMRWRKDYSAGKLARDNDADSLARDARIRELERMVGKLAMENELLKKAAEFMEARQRENSSIVTGPNVVPYKRGAR
jgi:transposase-like protein